MITRRRRTRQTRGQAIAEFALVLPIFVFLLVAVFDFGRGIYTFNGVSQAAREIARATVVNLGVVLGASTATTSTVNIQKALVPGLVVDSYACLTVTGTASTADPCKSGDFVRVSVSSSYTPMSLLGLSGAITLRSSSTLQVP
jgi:Flp pilus assembly protein TadG